MEHTEEKSNAYKEGWNSNCQGHSRLSGHQYQLGSQERLEWLKGYDEAQKEWESGKEPRFISIQYKNPHTENEGWKKLSYN